MKKQYVILFSLAFLFLALSESQAQVHIGVYKGGIFPQFGVGTDIEKTAFGEIRLMAGDVTTTLGIEAYGHYNLHQSDWYNFHLGLMLGLSDLDDGKIGLPVGLSFKPIAAHRHFSILLEGMPMYVNDGIGLRANIGLRYNFGKN